MDNVRFESKQRDNDFRSYAKQINPGEIAEYISHQMALDGYETQAIDISDKEAVAQIRKVGKLRAIFGLRQSLTVRLLVDENGTMVEIGKAAWIDKAVGAIIGWVIILIPLVTSIIGIYHQHLARKKIWTLIEHRIST